MIRIISILTFLLLTTSSAKADFSCPKLQARVNDYIGAIPSQIKESLEAKLKALEEKTSAQIAILTVPDSQGMSFEDFTLKVAETWALGQKGKDNGLLIAYTPEGDHFRIQVGYGLEGAITDGKAGKIRDDQFRKYAPKSGQKDFISAFTATVDEISKIIYEEYAKDPSGASMQGVNKEHVAIVLVLMVVILIIGCFHPIAGAIAGFICGIVAGSVIGYVVLCVIIGVILGAIAGLLKEVGGEVLLSDGGFCGGGGGFGGGGAGD